MAEQVPGLTTRYARQTGPAEQVVASVAMALGGRAGARLARRLAVPVSRMTLLRVIRRVPYQPENQPSVAQVGSGQRRPRTAYSADGIYRAFTAPSGSEC